MPLIEPSIAGYERVGFSLQPASVIRLLARLRTLAVGLLVIALAGLQLGGLVSSPAVWALPALLAGFNLWLWHTGHRRAEPPAGYALVVHLALDTLVLFAFFWAIGGASNPFVSLFLLPVGFAGAALDLRGAIVITVLSILCYTTLLWRYLDQVGDPMEMIGFERHVIGMWITFVLASLLLCGFLLALAARIRDRERMLADARERALREETVVSVATVAAGAAHALNTPLASIFVAAESLAEHPGLPDDAREDVITIREQSEVAASELRALVAARDAEAQSTIQIEVFLDEVLARWRIRRPEVELDIAAWRPLERQCVRRDPALAQALHNLLDNAADAALAAHRPRLRLARRVRRRYMIMTIDDPGPTAVERLRSADTDSTKPGGLGLGLTLARASLARLGGRLVFDASPDGGTRTRISLPLSALAPR